MLESLGAPAVGAIGWSGGSTQAYILAVANTRVKASACFFSFMALRHQFYRYRCCLYHFIPGMVQAGIDWDQVVALIRPRKIFLGWAAKDNGSSEPMYRAFVEAIRAGRGEDDAGQCVFVHENADGGHEITPAMLDDAMVLLKAGLTTP